MIIDRDSSGDSSGVFFFHAHESNFLLFHSDVFGAHACRPEISSRSRSRVFATLFSRIYVRRDTRAAKIVASRPADELISRKERLEISNPSESKTRFEALLVVRNKSPLISGDLLRTEITRAAI